MRTVSNERLAAAFARLLQRSTPFQHSHTDLVEVVADRGRDDLRNAPRNLGLA